MKETKPQIKFLTVEELAARWKISKSAIYNGISKKTFQPKPIKIGRLVRFRLQDIEKYETTL